MSDRFYQTYHNHDYASSFLEIAALHDLDPSLWEQAQQWAKDTKKDLLKNCLNASERKLWEELLKEQPEYKRAKFRIEQLRIKHRGY